jgi:hypothetical protein
MDTSVDWMHVDIGVRPGERKIRLLQKRESEWAQAADWAVGAIFDALNPDEFGNVETRYLETLAPRIYRSGNVFSYGLKFLPNTSAPQHAWAGLFPS